MSVVRVRFAPSPTGSLHLGSALTAVANFLFARRAGGAAILRIDDTDPLRSDRGLEQAIREDAEWLGLRFDEGPDDDGPFGPYRQSERGPLYRAHAERLVAAGLAHCEAGSGAVLFRMPQRDVTVPDGTRGDVRVPAGAVSDFVLLRSDGTATYTLATAVDDALMEISHVIRGEDHLTNTARQIALLEALELRAPRYAHTALLVGDDGAKLSKRHGAPSVTDIRASGHPPEALVNYLAQLACPAVGDEPALLGALAGRFDLAQLSRGASHFDGGRLDWLAQEHLKRLNPLELARRVGARLELRGVPVAPALLAVLGPALRGCHTLVAAAEEVEGVVRAPLSRPLLDAGEREGVRLFAELRAARPEPFLDLDEAAGLIGELKRRGAEASLSAREVQHGLRLALTGRERGLQLPYVVAAIEREDALGRAGATAEAAA